MKSRVIVRRFALSAILTLALTPVVVSPTAAGSDVSASPTGRALAAEVAARFTLRGLPTRPEDLRVIGLGVDGFVVVPIKSHVGDDGSIRTLDASEAQWATTPAVVTASTWDPVADQCFARYHGGAPASYMDTCYHLDKLSNDGSASYDYYSLHVFATVSGSTQFLERITSAYVSSVPFASPTQYWFDWSPRGDSQGSCRTIGLGISYIATVTYSHTACETWTLTKWADGGHFKEAWSGGNTYGAREVAQMVGVKVVQGAWPQWTIPYNFTWIYD